MARDFPATTLTFDAVWHDDGRPLIYRVLEVASELAKEEEWLQEASAQRAANASWRVHDWCGAIQSRGLQDRCNAAHKFGLSVAARLTEIAMTRVHARLGGVLLRERGSSNERQVMVCRSQPRIAEQRRHALRRSTSSESWIWIQTIVGQDSGRPPGPRNVTLRRVGTMMPDISR